MKTSLFLLAAGAMLATASPLNLQKKDAPAEAAKTDGSAKRPSIYMLATPGGKPTVMPAAPEPAAGSNSIALANRAPQTAPSSLDDAFYKFIVIRQHNYHRANHSATTGVWNQTLAGYAQTVASSCIFAHDVSPGGGGYGQNLVAIGSTGSITGKQYVYAAAGISNAWYNGEMPNWNNYGQPNPPPGLAIELWGHFTQVVWKTSAQIGCATAYCPAGTIFSVHSWNTVCNYRLQGNIGGQYGTNVLSPLGNPTVSVQVY